VYNLITNLPIVNIVDQRYNQLW